ncbi:MAG: hypothetical protein AUK44_07005 [Porphyromonadaceae bacterium CG2_30_38_12]|nr:MAG: hypothetical protein AUK44_07005 [Porphyromonadaceae bacterium CG2_30_38_12]
MVNAGFENKSAQKISTKSGEWLIHSNFTTAEKGIIDAEVSFKLISGSETESAVAVELNFDNWSKENFVLMPATAYNGNRYESRKIPYSPKLNDYRDIGPDKPMIISDVPRLNIHEGPSFIQERSGGMTLPCVGFHSPTEKTGALVITKQQNAWGDLGINIEETRNLSSQMGRISIISPLVRERYKYEIANNSVASPDVPANFKPGDEVKFTFRIRMFDAPNIQSLFDQYFIARHDLAPPSTPNLLYSFSECYKTIEHKFNTQNFVPEWGYYAIGMRENFLQDWQIGWTGGMISTYPLLFSKDTTTLKNVTANFNWLFPNGISPSGFFWDSGEKGNRWYGGDIRKPQFKNLHLVRKSGDALYYIIKQLELMKLRKLQINPQWEQGTMGVANAFVRLWNKWGQFGNFVDSSTGDVVVGGSTSGAIVPAALVLAADYFKNPQYLKVAELSAQKMYDDYVSKGITCGGPGDAMQNPDSESGYAMLESFALLYEKTRNEKWLQYSREMAAQFSTWVMSYDYEYAENCLFGKLNMKTTGTVFANTQNKHGSPGICTHSGLALLRLYRATNNPIYLQLLTEITQAIPQYMSHTTRPIAGMPAGWINERVSTTDWFEGIGEIKAGSTWAETSMLLTAVELPSIYVDAELKTCFSFDHLIAEIVKVGAKKVQLKVTNPTKFDANFKILVENKILKATSWEQNKLLNMKKYSLKAGEMKVIIIAPHL